MSSSATDDPLTLKGLPGPPSALGDGASEPSSPPPPGYRVSHTISCRKPTNVSKPVLHSSPYLSHCLLGNSDASQLPLSLPAEKTGAAQGPGSGHTLSGGRAAAGEGWVSGGGLVPVGRV